MASIGKHIKEQRKKKNMSQDDLAAKIFTTRQTISNYENGKSNPDIETLEKLAKALNTDITKYEDYIGENAKEEYVNKMGMDEGIFPQSITEKMQINDYKMVYYNPWDPQYLSYLVVQYDEEDYEEEMKRLQDLGIEEYEGYYGVNGFEEKYELLAMNADSYYGFIYALTDNAGTIVYVEILFCNYFMDIQYEDYINFEYLPLGFDATEDNEYRNSVMNE